MSGGAKDNAYQVNQTRVQINPRMILTWSQKDSKINQDLAQEQMKGTVQLIKATHTIFLRLCHILILLEVVGVYECLIV